MPLTPEDVSNKRFTPVRLREGYDMGEVDQFLDEVEAELARLLSENAALSGTAGAGSATAAESEAAPPSEEEAAAEAADAGSQEAGGSTGATAAADGETVRVQTVPQASNAAARLLEIATRNADELVDGAKDEADKILGEARTKAERREAESKENADKLEADARGRSQMLDSETAERRTELLHNLEQERDALAGEVDNLRAFEREYRSRLKTYFNQQLEALESAGDPIADADSTDRPQSILTDDG